MSDDPIIVRRPNIITRAMAALSRVGAWIKEKMGLGK